MENEIAKRRNLRDEYEAQTGRSSMPPMWQDQSFTDEYTMWLEERIINNE